MLFQTLAVGVTVLVVWKIVAWVIWYAKFCKQLQKLPQKPGHWLLGNIKDLRDAKTYMQAVVSMVKSKRNRLFCFWVGPVPFAGVCHPDTFRQLLPQVHEKARGFSDGYRFILPWLGDGLLVSRGQKWKRNRHLLTPAFHFEILKGYMMVMNTCSSTLCDKLTQACKKGESVEIDQYFSRSALDVMMKCTLSYSGSMQDDSATEYIDGVQEASTILFQRMVNPLLMFDFVFNHLTAGGRRHRELVNMFHKFTGTLIEARKKEIRTQTEGLDRKRYLDFLDILLTAKDEKGEGLTDQEIQNEVDTFVFEGHDTTSSALSWAAYCLGKYPEVQEKAYREVTEVIRADKEFTQEHLGKLTYLTQIIKETMRLFYPVPLISRRHSSPVILDGIEIPVGLRIDINIASIHHHPAVWKDPDVFRPERFDADNRDNNELFGFVPFSAGIRNCIGQVFAMNEIKVTLGMLLKRFKIVLDTTKPTEPDPCIVTHSTNGVWVWLKER